MSAWKLVGLVLVVGCVAGNIGGMVGKREGKKAVAKHKETYVPNPELKK